MAITKARKQEIVADVVTALKGASTVTFVSFKGLSANNTVKFRKQLTGGNVGYVVAKKSLIKRALAEVGVTGEMPKIPAEVAIAYGADKIAPAREVFDFAKKNKDGVTMLGGIFDGKYVSQAEIISIASIPPVETLRGQLVYLLQSPIQRFAMVLDAIAKAKPQQ
jgi:large subunit ribosomal protein L10